ncbi:MAG: hypothetical protein PHU85_01045, partial [Phycisphaerae bacterium]|nr:hypothetical protein [Phycisphaerae bacterium]
AGLLYAAAVNSANIQGFDCATGKKLRQFSTNGRQLVSLGVDADGAIYAGETGRAEKYVRQPTGTYQRAFKIGDTKLGRVTAIEVVGDEIVCADATAKKLLRCDLATGVELGKEIPTAQVELGKPPPRVIVPNDVLDFAALPTGQVLMAHPGRHSVQVYSLDGKLVTQWGRFDERAADGFTGCCNPINVAVFPLSTVGRTGPGIVTAEKGPPRVKVYDLSGKMLALIAAENFNANNRRMEVAVDADGRIYVADSEAKLIRRFKAKK